MAKKAPCVRISEPIVHFVGTGRGGDRTTRLLLFAAVLLLTSGVTVGGWTAWGWWGRVRAVHAAQERLAAEWARDARHTRAGAAAAAEVAGRRPPAPMPFGGAPQETGDAAADGGPV